MNIDKIFDPKEIEGLNGPTLQQKSQEIKQRFDFRRNYYHSLRNTNVNIEEWIELNNILVEFDRVHYPNWNNQWNNIYRTPNPQNIINYFEQGKTIFQEIENKIESLNINQYVHSEEIEALKKEIIYKIDNDFITLKTEVLENIKNGIEDVLNLKAELGLHQNFSENLNTVKTNTNTAKNWFFAGFIFSLLLIAGSIILTYKLDFILKLQVWEKITIRLAITITLGFLSYFLFHQFKLYQMLHLKYTHLSNFLGGGATYINQIIGQDGDLKKETNQKLADMFMEIDDTLGIVKKMKHPTEASFNSTNDMLTNLLDKLADISKNISEMKK